MTGASSVLLFDTQLAVEELVAAGMPPEQARVVVRQQAHWADRDFATREDIDRLREEFDRKIEAQGEAIAKDIAHLRESLDHKFTVQRAALEAQVVQSGSNTIKWVTTSQIGTAAVFLAALLAAIKL